MKATLIALTLCLSISAASAAKPGLDPHAKPGTDPHWYQVVLDWFLPGDGLA